jgi:hypothetical protein
LAAGCSWVVESYLAAESLMVVDCSRPIEVVPVFPGCLMLRNRTASAQPFQQTRVS